MIFYFILFFFLEGMNLSEGKRGENLPDFCISMAKLKEAPMCLSS